MSGPGHNPLRKQGSLSHIEQSLKIIPTPPQEAPVTIYPGPKAGNVNLSKADLEIAHRLEKLRKKDVDLPTEEEMASRLAQLKGLPCDHYTKPSGIIYQAPDNRTDTEKSRDLFVQVLQEVQIDAKVPKADDEIEKRLARLRGEPDPAPSESRTGNVPYVQSPSGGRPKAMDFNEVQELMREAQKEVGEARAAFNALRGDNELTAAMKETSKRHKLSSRSTSNEERFSDSTDDENCTAGRGDAKATQVETEEVERVVQLYTKKAQQKKERRKRRALRKKDTKESDSSGAELSSSNLEVSTSESENFSDSD